MADFVPKNEFERKLVQGILFLNGDIPDKETAQGNTNGMTSLAIVQQEADAEHDKFNNDDPVD